MARRKQPPLTKEQKRRIAFIQKHGGWSYEGALLRKKYGSLVLGRWVPTVIVGEPFGPEAFVWTEEELRDDVKVVSDTTQSDASGDEEQPRG